MSNDEIVAEGQECPYCSRTSGCAHVLLVVDRTFRSAKGGTLMNEFNSRWATINEDSRSDFNEREAFQTLLDEVNSLATAESEYEFEGGPGMSSAFVIYFVESDTMAQSALHHFSKSE